MLPKMIDTRKHADQHSEYQGVLQASELPRLNDAVEEIAQVQVEVNFGRDEQRRMQIRGTATCAVSMICQRCLQPSDQEMTITLDAVMVFSDERAKAMPQTLDVWVVPEIANLHELIEDELLLALPIVAYHAESVGCTPPEIVAATEEVEPAPVERESPFAVLRALKTEQDG